MSTAAHNFMIMKALDLLLLLLNDALHVDDDR